MAVLIAAVGTRKWSKRAGNIVSPPSCYPRDAVLAACAVFDVALYLSDSHIRVLSKRIDGSSCFSA